MLKHFLVKRGDQLSFTITFSAAFNPTALQMGVKKHYTDEVFTIIKSLGHGISKLSDTKYQFIIDPEETKNLDITDYVYDVQLKIGSVVKTPLSGKLMIKETTFETE